MVSVNTRALRLVREMMERKKDLGVGVDTLRCGATVLDCTDGTLGAGVLYARVCMGDLASVVLSDGKVCVSTDDPLTACMASQYAGWNLKVRYSDCGKEKKFKASASGPARSLARAENLFDEIEYRDDSDHAVITIETRAFPREETASFVAEACAVAPETLFILFAPTASLVGSVQISARVVEVGMHKMRVLGFPLSRITSASGRAPLAPVGRDDADAMGKTNDCILYGGETHYTVDCGDDEVSRIIDAVPSSSSKDYGKSFRNIFEEAQFEFSRLNPALFSPSVVTIVNASTGKRWTRGQVNHEILRQSFSY